MMRIGLLGLTFGSSNMGCEALGYGFLNVLEKTAELMGQVFDVRIFEKCDIELIKENGNYERLNLSSVPIPGIKKIKDIRTHIKNFKNCDCIFDFTAGDSFSDIYGKKRFFIRTIIKRLAELSGTPFVLGSQTYGPYNSKWVTRFAKRVIQKASGVYARDWMSWDLASKLSGRKVTQTVDVAFAMQYKKTTIPSNKILVGFNPSGLLWNGGYTRNNQFGLTVDYQKYCIEVIRNLLDRGDCEIHLIPHVLSDDMKKADNDKVACEKLKSLFPSLIVAPDFKTPVEAKSYISAMDFFIGARMHATIAAFTTGVPVVPFSYSPKFEGLYTSVGYNHVISAKKVTTEEAVKQTLELLNDRSVLRKELIEHSPEIEKGVFFLVRMTECEIRLAGEKRDRSY